MKPKVLKSLYKYLNEVRSERTPVCLHSSAAPLVRDTGYVVGLSRSFVLVHTFDRNLFTMNGYDVWPLPIIKQVTGQTYQADIIGRGLWAKGIGPVTPQNVDIDGDLAALLSSIDAHFPLTVLRLHRRKPGVRFIGRIAHLGEKSVTLREIGADARWKRNRKFRYKDITRISFGGGYEEALWLVSQQERERSGRSIDHDSSIDHDKRG